MFEVEIENRGFSGALFVAQLFGAPLVCFAAGLVSSSVVLGALSLLGLRSEEAADVLGYIDYATVGLLVGISAQRVWPRCHTSGGGWVWIPPVALLVIGVVDQLTRNPKKVVGSYFLVGASEEAAFAVVLITLPAVATCCYSFGVARASRRATNEA